MKNLKKGDKVVMHTCGEADHYKGRTWICRSDSFMSKSKHEVVFLKGFSGHFLCEYLQIIESKSISKNQIALILIIILMYTAFIYRCGVQKGLHIAENAGELALEAAAQQYKNDLTNDTIRFEHYGTERFQKATPKYILPENSRTKGASFKAPNNKKTTPTRKRTF
ncbi:MAG: hypothetical protein JEY96_01685 [Bacteroidales bacterium]|nr:hypothetical protein [Bacteroidales bacterium]